VAGVMGLLIRVINDEGTIHGPRHLLTIVLLAHCLKARSEEGAHRASSQTVEDRLSHHSSRRAI
jgi:hypothetical protein